MLSKKLKRKITNYRYRYGKGISISKALRRSNKEDKQRSINELSIFYLSGTPAPMFSFIVKASGKHMFNEFGVKKNHIAKKHKVNILFDTSNADYSMSPLELIRSLPVKYECGCGRHTYYYRFIWTIGLKSSLGLQQTQYPLIRNKPLKGVLCKHGIKVMDSLWRGKHLKAFERFISKNKRKD